MQELNAPTHIAIIPDGNRRWAKTQKLKPWIGHQKGAQNTTKIIEEAQQLGINYLSFWIASLDNLNKRPKKEVNYLCRVFTKYFNQLAEEPEIHKQQVRVKIYGFLEEVFPPETAKAARLAEEKTRNYNGPQLSFLMGYDGKTEMIEATNRIVKAALAANPHPQPVTQEMIHANLWTHDLPPVDLLVRTGTDDAPHLSGGFLMWQTAYSQLYFTNTLYPEFSPEELRKAIKDYTKRERRFGS